MKENRLNSSHGRRKKREGAKEKDGEMGGEDAEGAQSREREREKEKNNESSERQECFSGNVFQENEEGNIMLRKKGLFGSQNGFENVIIAEETASTGNPS